MEAGGRLQRKGQSEDQEDRVSRPNAIARAFLSFDSPHCFLSSLDSADDSLVASVEVRKIPKPTLEASCFLPTRVRRGG